MIKGKDLYLITHKSEIYALADSPVKIARIICDLNTVPTIKIAWSEAGTLKTQKLLKIDLKNGIKKLLTGPHLTSAEKTKLCKILRIPVPHHLSERAAPKRKTTARKTKTITAKRKRKTF